MGCVARDGKELSSSKIIFFDSINFEEILSIDTFSKDAHYIVLENEIIIQSYETLTIYDINSLEPIKVIKFEEGLQFLYKFDNEHLIAYSVHEEKSNLVIYKIENNNLIKNYVIGAKLFGKIFGWNHNRMIGGSYSILILGDKRIIICFYSQMYLFEIIKD